ncbi:hypothetical protein ACFPZI_13355 [Streptomyces chlorus]|uniref:Uncharacterized protein n=1 Tax=Streptomyces chlorus TaxID=887452 RepID=A0ABW1DY15_9ACTN
MGDDWCQARRRAGELAERLSPGEALTEWLHELGTGMIRIRGLRALLGSAVGATAMTVATAVRPATPPTAASP